MRPQTTIRRARRDDCLDIARLFRIASDGVADYIWGNMATDGRDPLAVGAERYRREGVDFSYQNCLIAERNGQIVGMMHSYLMARDREPPTADFDPVLRPYAELEAPGSLYISGLAFYPAARGQGLGTRFLEFARARAIRHGAPSVSLIVFERNEGARRLYERHGFHEIDRRPVVPHPLIHFTGDALLMARPASTETATVREAAA